MKKQLEGIRILIVDDEASILEALSDNLVMHGATIYSAGNGLEAMEVLKDNMVDFILSDMRMPKANGIQFLKNLKITYPHPPPFFFLTGYAEEYSTEQMRELGSNGVLSKPFKIKELIELILANVKK